MPFIHGLLLFLAIPHTAHAHNWLDNPSGRAGGGLSKTAPCKKGTPKLHHLMVGPGQTFHIQWSAGHGGNTYFALVARGDEEHLSELSDKLMEEYLAEAPAGAKSSEAGGFMSGADKAKVHMRFARSGTSSQELSINPVGAVSTDLTKFKTSIFGNRNAYPYVKRMVKGDPGFIAIPEGWRCNRNPNLGGMSRPPQGGSCSSGKDPRMEQFSYHPRYSTNTDLSAGYASAKYPWLVAVYRYRIIKHTPMDSDGGWFMFPPHAAPGEYVINYRWRGYYDCLDTVLLTKPAVDVYGRRSSEKRWQRNDHSHFPWHGAWPGTLVGGFYTVGTGEAKARNPSYHKGMWCEVVPNDKNNIASSLKKCADWSQCEAVNCVPISAPPSVIYNATSLVNAPYNWGFPKKCSAKYVAGQANKYRGKAPLLCYGFRKPTSRPDVGFSYVRDRVMVRVMVREEIRRWLCTFSTARGGFLQSF